MDATTASDLFARHYRDIHRYLARMAGRPDVADDLAQEVFLRAVRALDAGGDAIGHERGWIFAVARHLLVDYRRREGTAARRRGDAQRLAARDAAPVSRGHEDITVDHVARRLRRRREMSLAVTVLRPCESRTLSVQSSPTRCNLEGRWSRPGVSHRVDTTRVQ